MDQLNGPIKPLIHSYPPNSPKINSNQPARGQRREASCAQILTLTVLLQLGEFSWAQTHPVSHLASQSARNEPGEPR